MRRTDEELKHDLEDHYGCDDSCRYKNLSDTIDALKLERDAAEAAALERAAHLADLVRCGKELPNKQFLPDEIRGLITPGRSSALAEHDKWVEEETWKHIFKSIQEPWKLCGCDNCKKMAEIIKSVGDCLVKLVAGDIRRGESPLKDIQSSITQVIAQARLETLIECRMIYLEGQFGAWIDNEIAELEAAAGRK